MRPSASGIALAWLLIPADYAVFAVASLVLTVLLSVNELGVTVVVVRHPDDPTPLLPTAATIAMGFSASLYALTFLVAGPISRSLGVPAASNVIHVLAIGVLIDGLTAIPNALLIRYFQQAKRTVAEFAGTVASSAFMVAGGLAGLGAWSFVVGTLAGSALSGLVVWHYAPKRPRLGWDRSRARELLRASLPLASASLLVLAMLNVDYVVVARMLGPTNLAFYVFAFNISNWLPGILTMAVRRVAIPGFARLQHDRAAFGAAFSQTLGLLLAVAGCLSAALVLCAPRLIDALYDEQKWGDAAPALRYLAILAFVRILLDLAYDGLAGLGKGRVMMAIQGLWLAALIPSLIVGARVGGIEGVATAHAGVALVLVLPCFAIALIRSGVSATGLARQLARPLVAVAVAGAALSALTATSLGPWSLLMTAGVAVVASFGLVLLPGGWLSARALPAP